MPNNRIFIDTAYVYALINPNDQWHAAASRLYAALSKEKAQFVTTEFVLIEIADGLSSILFRAAAIRSIRLFHDSPDAEVVPATSGLLLRGLELYEARGDKNWGLTDCISFVIMQEFGLTDALTTDDHFRQAGFNALLLGS